MSDALNAVTRGELKPSEAVVKLGVSRQTLRDSGRVIHGTKPGPRPYLTKQDEEILADHLILTARLGSVPKHLHCKKRRVQELQIAVTITAK